MADFAQFGVAEKALGWTAGSFLQASADDSWQGSASELLERLNVIADDAVRRSKEWPGQPQHLGNKLR